MERTAADRLTQRLHQLQPCVIGRVGQQHDELLATARAAGDLLVQRGETVGVAEGSCGGLVSAALLAVPGASAYYR
ncbi:CinA family protein, partial [Klebsiella pneumoniae]|uniref:CinA family protein n=1 Tax=Klebsiella pneumoniae TaxID=573 RepID=UPI0035C8621F|nr:CinA family protein [Klebsiella pneumoniae]